jgi:ATP-dependent DNA ligase
VTTTSVFLSRRAGIDVEQAKPTEKTPLALVCLDLLRVDGQDLFDVPLLERKRLLEGLIQGSERVRVSPFTRPPAEPWIASWKAAGFKGGMLKAANSRYVPGRHTPEWVPITMVRARH